MTDSTDNAQVDYEARIRSALVPAGVTVDVQALLDRLTFEAVNGEIDRKFAGDLAAALRALSEGRT
jgi:hypothetical protein